MENEHKNFIESIRKYGFYDNSILKLINHFPLKYNIDVLYEKVLEVISFLSEKPFLYSHDEVIKIISSYYKMSFYSISFLTEKFLFLVSLGYSEENVRKIIKDYPQIISYSVSHLTDKINYYKSIGLGELIIICPKNIMQSTRLSYARREYLKILGVSISLDNYNELFRMENEFLRLYDITTDQLLQIYDFDTVKEDGNKEIGLIFSEDEREELIKLNPDIKNVSENNFNKLIDILNGLRLNSNRLKNIIKSNPFYLSRNITDVESLMRKINDKKINNIDVIIDTYPLFLNCYDNDIDKFFDIKRKEGLNDTEIIELIEINPYLIDEI